MSYEDFYSICKKINKKIEFKAIKKLSQHFLLDCDSIKVFYDNLIKYKNQDFLEIGTGIGTITFPISLIAKRVITVEIDRRFSYLKKELPDNVEIIFGNGLEFVKSTKLPILISNMPYNISSNLLINLSKNNNIKYSVLGMQKEVAERITANPGEDNYGRLSVIMQSLFNIKIVANIPSEKFFPKPKVDSSIVVMERNNLWKDEFNLLEKFTACLFSQKNKKAQKIINNCLSDIKQIKIDCLQDKNKRVKDLTPKEILCLLF